MSATSKKDVSQRYDQLPQSDNLGVGDENAGISGARVFQPWYVPHLLYQFRPDEFMNNRVLRVGGLRPSYPLI